MPRASGLLQRMRRCLTEAELEYSDCFFLRSFKRGNLGLMMGENMKQELYTVSFNSLKQICCP